MSQRVFLSVAGRILLVLLSLSANFAAVYFAFPVYIRAVFNNAVECIVTVQGFSSDTITVTGFKIWSSMLGSAGVGLGALVLFLSRICGKYDLRKVARLGKICGVYAIACTVLFALLPWLDFYYEAIDQGIDCFIMIRIGWVFHAIWFSGECQKMGEELITDNSNPIHNPTRVEQLAAKGVPHRWTSACQDLVYGTSSILFLRLAWFALPLGIYSIVLGWRHVRMVEHGRSGFSYLLLGSICISLGIANLVLPYLQSALVWVLLPSGVYAIARGVRRFGNVGLGLVGFACIALGILGVVLSLDFLGRWVIPDILRQGKLLL